MKDDFQTEVALETRKNLKRTAIYLLSVAVIAELAALTSFETAH